jgi:hypothetical protein
MLRKNSLVLVVAATLVIFVAAPAGAATTWKIGTPVGKPSMLQQDAIVESWASGCPDTMDALATLKRDGDVVHVRDNCQDGRSAVALVQTLSGPNEGDRRICRNKEGVGTWVRCNWNWAEGEGYEFVAGVYNGNTGYLSWDFGAGVYFND